MVYGLDTRSYNRSAEKRAMDKERREVTERHFNLCSCGQAGEFLCSWKLRTSLDPGNPSTCGRPICAKHAKQVVLGKYLCPEHVRHYEHWKRRKRDNAQASLFR